MNLQNAALRSIDTCTGCQIASSRIRRSLHALNASCSAPLLQRSCKRRMSDRPDRPVTFLCSSEPFDASIVSGSTENSCCSLKWNGSTSHFFDTKVPDTGYGYPKFNCISFISFQNILFSTDFTSYKKLCLLIFYFFSTLQKWKI